MTETPETFAPLDDGHWAEADRLRSALVRHGSTGVTPSAAARTAGTPRNPEHGDPTDYARWLLDRLVERGYAHTSGVGRQTRYWPGRAR